MLLSICFFTCSASFILSSTNLEWYFHSCLANTLLQYIKLHGVCGFTVLFWEKRDFHSPGMLSITDSDIYRFTSLLVGADGSTFSHRPGISVLSGAHNCLFFPCKFIATGYQLLVTEITGSPVAALLLLPAAPIASYGYFHSPVATHAPNQRCRSIEYYIQNGENWERVRGVGYVRRVGLSPACRVHGNMFTCVVC